jgi:hypothetical protein
MAMNGNEMGSEIAAAIMNTDAPPEVQAQVTALWQKIGAAIVTHIQKNAEVPAGITVSTTGSPAAQTGSTTGTGKVK